MALFGDYRHSVQREVIQIFQILSGFSGIALCSAKGGSNPTYQNLTAALCSSGSNIEVVIVSTFPQSDNHCTSMS